MKTAAMPAAPPAAGVPSMATVIPFQTTTGQPNMPLILKRVILQRGISQRALAQAVPQANGRPLSGTAMTQIINYGSYPRGTPTAVIRGHVEQYLREHGAGDDELAGIWRMDHAPGELRLLHPAGCHQSPRRTPDEPDTEPVETEMLSAAARKTFELFRDPFQDDVRGPEHIFRSQDYRYVREYIFQTAQQGGFVAVVGESGAGKSVARRDLVDRIEREELPVRIIQPRSIDKATLTARAIWEAILDDLRPGERPRATLERLARQVEKILIEHDQAGQRHLIIIEEAHDLSLPTLKYLKRFLEVEVGFRKLLSVLLIAQPELKMKLARAEVREVARRCQIVELLPLDNELQPYVEFKFKAVGKDAGSIFDDGAYQALREKLVTPGASGPVSLCYPILVNIEITRALNTAAEIGAQRITADIVRARGRK